MCTAADHGADEAHLAEVVPDGAPTSQRPDPALITDLVIANRILFDQNVVDAFGHVSVRHEARPDRFLLARSMAPALVTADDILEFDLDGSPVAANNRPVYLERFIHSEIYRARPDVQAVVHSHSLAVIPFGMVHGLPMRAVWHMSGFLGTATPVYEIREDTGDGSDLLISSAALGASLARKLGPTAAVLMRGHGITVVGTALRQAVYRAVYAEINARLQLQMIGHGAVNYLTGAEAAATSASSDKQLGRAWDMWKMRVRGKAVMFRRNALAALVLALVLPAGAKADAVTDFYRGRTVTMIVGYTVGGGYDTYARVLARHLGKHIPGNPTIVLQNMPGAGSLRSANYLYNVAPKDGSDHRHLLPRHGDGAADRRAARPSSTPRKFTWLGSGTNEVSICVTWHTSPVKTWNDMLTKPFTVGGEGSGSDPDIFATVVRNVFGVKLQAGHRLSGQRRDGARDRARRGRRPLRLVLVEPQDAAARLDRATRRSTSWCSSPWPRRAELPDVPLITDFATTERAAADPASWCSAARRWRGRSWRRPAFRPTASRRCARRSTTPWRTPSSSPRPSSAGSRSIR